MLLQTMGGQQNIDLYCYGRELNGVLGERFIFRVGVFADRGMLPGLARTTALTTIAVQLRLN